VVGGLYRRLVLCAGLAGVLVLSVAASAGATTITLGSVATPGGGGCGNCNIMGFQSAPGQPKYRVPAGPTGFWTITSWASQGGGGLAGHAQLRVYRKTAVTGQYRMVRQSALETVPPNGHPGHPTHLNVMKGDLLGLTTLDNLVAGYTTGNPGDNVKLIFGSLTGPGDIVGPGTSHTFGNLPMDLVNVSATLKSR